MKLVDKFTNLGSSVSSTENDINTWLAKAWTAIDSLSVIRKSDLTDKTKRSFFQAAVGSILLYGCTTWTLTKRIEEKLDANNTRMLWAILNKSWRQRPTKQQLYGHLSTSWKLSNFDEPVMQDTTEEVKAMYSGGPLQIDEQRQDDQLEPINSSSVPIQDVAWKTSRERWTIEGDGERGLGRSVLAARHDDDDDDMAGL